MLFENRRHSETPYILLHVINIFWLKLSRICNVSVEEKFEQSTLESECKFYTVRLM